MPCSLLWSVDEEKSVLEFCHPGHLLDVEVDMRLYSVARERPLVRASGLYFVPVPVPVPVPACVHPLLRLVIFVQHDEWACDGAGC